MFKTYAAISLLVLCSEVLIPIAVEQTPFSTASAQPPLADQTSSASIRSLENIKSQLRKNWPDNRLIRLVFHGHSVPAGYFDTPIVRRYDSYPMLSHHQLCRTYPTAVIDINVTAIGGEHSQSGAERFEADVLSLKPDLIFIDYAMNDRGIGLERAEKAWRSMIEASQKRGIPVVLLTSTPTSQEDILDPQTPLALHADQIRRLAKEYDVPLVDAYQQFKSLVAGGQPMQDYLSHAVHPNRSGHKVVADQIEALFR